MTDNRGYSLGAAGLHLTSLDMVTVGVLYLDGGMAGGRQIVPAEWVRASTEARLSTGNAIPYGPSYGYQWWNGRTGTHEYYFAMGYGGQFIFNVPDLGLVVVATCDWRYWGGPAAQHWSEIIALIVNDVIPAME
jgi:CubicO group peptidase (beta-lactamase class C family)